MIPFIGAAKLEGSKVLNMSVNVKSSSCEVNNDSCAPIRAFMKRIEEPSIVFRAYDDMEGGMFKHSELVIKERLIRIC